MGDSPPDAAFRAIENDHRRRLLFSLLERDREDDVPLADAAAGPDAGDREVDLVLYHVHLPMLEDRGIVEWDRESGSVRRGPDFEEVRPLLELLDRHRDELPDGWL